MYQPQSRFSQDTYSLSLYFQESKQIAWETDSGLVLWFTCRLCWLKNSERLIDAGWQIMTETGSFGNVGSGLSHRSVYLERVQSYWWYSCSSLIDLEQHLLWCISFSIQAFTLCILKLLTKSLQPLIVLSSKAKQSLQRICNESASRKTVCTGTF